MFSPVLLNFFAIGGIVMSQTYKLPQIYKIYKLKQAGDISLSSVVIQDVSYLFWLTYGIGIMDYYYIIANSISFIQNIIIYGMKKHYTKPKILISEVKKLTNIVVENPEMIEIIT